MKTPMRVLCASLAVVPLVGLLVAGSPSVTEQIGPFDLPSVTPELFGPFDNEHDFDDVFQKEFIWRLSSANVLFPDTTLSITFAYGANGIITGSFPPNVRLLQPGKQSIDCGPVFLPQQCPEQVWIRFETDKTIKDIKGRFGHYCYVNFGFPMPATSVWGQAALGLALIGAAGWVLRRRTRVDPSAG